MGSCEICPGRPHVEDGRLADHARLLHPDLYGDGPLRWPDGGVAIEDQTGEWNDSPSV